MPIYEYYCPDNNRIYQFFAKTIAQGQSIPKCPDNPGFRMVKVVSGFAIGGATCKSRGGEASKPAGEGAEGMPGGGGGPDGGEDAGDPRMEAAFAQLEQEMSSVDENDPRAMGRMMRRMSELTGERLDGEMEEMVRKLEEGQDPEKIEEQMGDALGEPGEGDDEYGGMGGMGGGFGRSPSRDPNLYDY
ncbi:MAG: FmdB family transcriptional regulator [Opitutaceae bacterium]